MDTPKYGYPYPGSPYESRGTNGFPQQPYQRSHYPSPYSQPMQQTGYQPPVPQAVENALDGTQVLSGEGFKPLSKKERDEAARIAAEAGFSFNGYQVVRREFFSHKFDPTLTIRNGAITFNTACISKMEEVVYVQFLINPDNRKLVIRPCREGDRDAVRWCIVKEDKRKSRQISCNMFTAKIYDMMGWKPQYRYKVQGSQIDYQGRKLYVFDLNNVEIFIPTVQEGTNPDEKPKKKQIARFQEDWRDSFGLPVDVHDQSIQVDLGEGFELVNMESMPTVEQVPMEMIDQETGEVTKV